MKKRATPNHDFPKGLARPAIRALRPAGVTRLARLAAVPEEDLLKLRGMGPEAMSLLRSAMEARRKQRL
jgi:hypothetical protein